MLISAVAALVLFAAPEATQSGETAAPAADKPAAEAAAKPKKSCYKTTPPGSKLPKTVCVTEKAPKQEADKAEKGAPAA